MSWFLQEDSFHQCCRLIVQLSQQLRDGWSWEPVQGTQEGYLKKTLLRTVVTKSSPAEDRTGSCSDPGSHDSCHSCPDQLEKLTHVAVCDDEGDDEGEGICVTSEDCSSRVLQYEYHIVYSCSYSSPVLYFRAFTLEGRSLSLEEVWSCVHPNFKVRLQNSPLNTISQQEHPLLGQPFFMLHPCRTEEFMKPVLLEAEDEYRPVNFVLTWLSVVGPLVGLDVPLKYPALLQMQQQQNTLRLEPL